MSHSATIEQNKKLTLLPLDIPKEILEVIKANNIATVCCCEDNKPHCFSCFYTYMEDEACIIFKSSDSSRHMQILSENNMVAGTIIPSENSMTKVIGLQFEGLMVDKDAIGSRATRVYYTRYPFAVAVPGRIWVLQLKSIKYTNTTNGIKHKLEWVR